MHKMCYSLIDAARSSLCNLPPTRIIIIFFVWRAGGWRSVFSFSLCRSSPPLTLSLLHGARRPETEMQFGAATCIKCISVHSRALGPIKNAPVPRSLSSSARVVFVFRFAKNALQCAVKKCATTTFLCLFSEQIFCIVGFWYLKIDSPFCAGRCYSAIYVSRSKTLTILCWMHFLCLHCWQDKCWRNHVVLSSLLGGKRTSRIQFKGTWSTLMALYLILLICWYILFNY